MKSFRVLFFVEITLYTKKGGIALFSAKSHKIKV